MTGTDTPTSWRELFTRENMPPLITLSAPDTDDKGKTQLEWAGDQVKDTALPLKALIQARVFEPGNGRATKTDKTLPLRSRDLMTSTSHVLWRLPNARWATWMRACALWRRCWSRVRPTWIL